MGAPTGGKRSRLRREESSSQIRRESKRCKGAAILIALGIIIPTVSPASASYTRPTGLLRVDVPPSGQLEEDAYSQNSSITPDGRYIAFDSTSDQLVADDVNLVSDIFRKDMKTGAISLISMASTGAPSIGAEEPLSPAPGGLFLSSLDLSFDPSISPDGRVVTFVSEAINLVPGDTNLEADIFVVDVRTGRIDRVSVDSSGAEANSTLGRGSYRPSISPNGRYIAFSSDAVNLVADDTNETDDVFVHDRVTRQTVRASISSTGEEGRPPRLSPVLPEAIDDKFPSIKWYFPAASMNSNRYVVFSSSARNLVEGDSNGMPDIFMHDIKTRQTTRVSLGSNDTEAKDPLYDVRLFDDGFQGSSLTGGESSWPSGKTVSPDGRYIVFASKATNLVPNDTNGGIEPTHGTDVFVRDRTTGRTERVSVEPDGREINNQVRYEGSQLQSPSITSNGRFIAYFCTECVGAKPHSAFPDGVPSGSNEPDFDDDNVIVYDRQTGAVVVVPKPYRLSYASFTSISDDGRFATFSSLRYSEDLLDVLMPWLGGIYRVDLGGDVQTTMGDQQTSTKRAGPSSEAKDSVNESYLADHANLIEVSLTKREQYQDVYVEIELEHMPKVLPGISPIFYGLRFEVGGKSYEVRATSTLGGTFGLFDCEGLRPACTKVGDLRGGYGTTGERVVFSLPLPAIDLEDGGELSDVEAFSALGTQSTGATKILDWVRIR